MPFRTRAETVLVALAALAVPASCTQNVGHEDDSTLGGQSPGGSSAGGAGGGTPVPKDCLDGAQNGDETDLDCGGSTCPRCDIESTCDSGLDCKSGMCADGKCTCPEGAMPNALGACACESGELLCAGGCVSAISASIALDEIDPDEEAIALSVAASADGTFGVSWTLAVSKAVLFASVSPSDTPQAAVVDSAVAHSSSSLTPADSGASFVLSTLEYANTPPGYIRSYSAGSSGITNGDEVIQLYDSDRIDCARPGNVRCVYFHPDPDNIPTVQSVRYDPDAPGVTPTIDLNPRFALNASELAFPTIATDGTRSFMVWLGVANDSIRYAVDDGDSVEHDTDLELAGLGKVGRVDVAWHSPGVWLVAWDESPSGEPPFKIGLAAVDDAGAVLSQVSLSIGDTSLEVFGPLSVVVAETETGGRVGAIAFTTRDPQTAERALKLLYVDVGSPGTLSSSTPRRLVTLPPETGGGLESPALAYHPVRGLGLAFVHYAASLAESVELYRMPVCELFAPE